MDINLRYMRVYDSQGVDVINELQYWDNDDEIWKAIPYYQCQEKEYDKTYAIKMNETEFQEWLDSLPKREEMEDQE